MSDSRFCQLSFAEKLLCVDRHALQADLSRIQEKVEQQRAAATESTEAYQVLQQELSDCQQELATIQHDLTHWPDAW